MSEMIVSFSGGKDSTAMLHLMLERHESIKEVIWCDMGDWEFPEMARHIEQVERKTGVQIVRVRPKYDLTQMAFDHEYEHRGVPVRGYGWPNIHKRWCTKLKTSAIDAECKIIGGGVQCIGIAVDEVRRRRLPGKRYPLDEYGYTESDCLAYCKKLGYTWDGLYDVYKRVSCWCCPLQSLADLRILYRHKPEMWARLLEMDKRNPPHNRGFRDGQTLEMLGARFAEEMRQTTLIEEER